MKYINLFISFLLVQLLAAQTKLPVIKAASKNVAIRDGNFFDENAWTLSPETRPDIFTADRTRKTKWVTFYTDIDSIRVKVTPGSTYNFVILLNGKDSCYTQIKSAVPPKETVTNNQETCDIIPFILTAFNAIQVRAVLNGIDTLNLHFDIGSFDFRLTRDAIFKKTNLLSNQPDALAGKKKPDYGNLNKVDSLQIGSLTWKDPVLVPTGLTAHDMDGRFGWNLFEGKKVEIDYDRNVLIIHSKLPKVMKGYVKSDLEFLRSFVCIKANVKAKGKKYPGTFLIDTGSDQAVVLDSSWMARCNFPQDLKLIKSSVLSDPRGVKYDIQIVECPQLQLAAFELANVPTHLLRGKNPVQFEINYLGNDLLKRFNAIFDFEADQVYLKPNRLMPVKYREGI